MARKTRIDRSLFLTTPISPVRNASTPEVPASSIGIVSARLLKNVSPPRWPEATRSSKAAKNTANAASNPTDHLPKADCGKRLIRILLIINTGRTYVNHLLFLVSAQDSPKATSGLQGLGDSFCALNLLTFCADNCGR